MRPNADIKQLLRSLAEHHTFFIVSGRVCEEMQPWFADVPAIGIACEHGYRIKEPGSSEYAVQYPGLDFAWKEIVRPIMRMYAESTDGTHVQEKACGMTWAYSAADPDFGRWQVRSHSPALAKSSRCTLSMHQFGLGPIGLCPCIGPGRAPMCRR